MMLELGLATGVTDMEDGVDTSGSPIGFEYHRGRALCSIFCCRSVARLPEFKQIQCLLDHDGVGGLGRNHDHTT
jgi:hypothetical protein